MKNVPENELFSAYLDGELTAAEQAEMEQLLAKNSAARQLLEELRALSSALQMLPQHKLDVDLSQDVLREAERRMLTGESGQEAGWQTTKKSALWRTVAARLAKPRVWIWPAVALAAGLLIAVLTPPHHERLAMPTAVDRMVVDAPRSVDGPTSLPEIGAADDSRNAGKLLPASGGRARLGESVRDHEGLVVDKAGSSADLASDSGAMGRREGKAAAPMPAAPSSPAAAPASAVAKQPALKDRRFADEKDNRPAGGAVAGTNTKSPTDSAPLEKRAEITKAPAAAQAMGAVGLKTSGDSASKAVGRRP